MARKIAFFIIGILIMELRTCQGLDDPDNTELWKSAVIYDVAFARKVAGGFKNFQDVIDHFDYFKALKVDAIAVHSFIPWDIYNRYTVYNDVDERLGGMAGFERFLKGAHENGIKVILVVRPFETSDGHPWFWKWCWAQDPDFDNFYVELKERPSSGSINKWNDWRRVDLLQIFAMWSSHNVTNPETARRLKEDVFEFWLNKGVDGFIIRGLDDYIRQSERINRDAKGVVENNIKFSREIRIFVNDWTKEHNTTFKYVAAMTPSISAPWCVFYGRRKPPGVWPFHMFSTSDIVSLAERGNLTIRLKELIGEQLSMVPPEATTNWLAYLYGRGHPSDRKIDTWSPDNLTYQIIELRKNPVFRRGDWKVETSNNNSVLVLERGMFGDPTVYIAVFNFGETEETVDLTRLFANLEEQLNVILTSDTNEKLKLLKVMRRDSVSVSSGAVTVLESRRVEQEAKAEAEERATTVKLSEKTSCRRTRMRKDQRNGRKGRNNRRPRG